MAIRIARRDARRYKWRSALIVTMVGLPVLLLTSGITLLATKEVSLAESVPRVMGSAQARISVSGMGGLTQAPNGGLYGNDKHGVRPLVVPGFRVGSDWTTSKVQRLTGGRVIQTLDTSMRFSIGDRRPNMYVLGIDGRDPLAKGMTDLVSGRWASGPSEIVVTRAGLAAGLPPVGTLVTAGPDGKPRQLTVVGVATGQTDNPQLPWIVALPALVKAASNPEGVSAAFLVERANPVTWSNVRLLNDYGLVVKSRQVFVNPPPDSQLDPQVAQAVSSGQRQLDLVFLIAALGLFIETTLLAGPAFAVSAARQRRSLALAASNGAQRRQLRRYVLGQAVVLGLVSAGVAVVAGVLLTWAGLSWWQDGHADFVTGPFEVSWPRVLGVFVCAVVASVVAALIPAKGIARLDIVSVLAGRSGDRSVRRGLPIGGVAVMVLMGLGLIWSVAYGGEGGLARQGSLIAAGAVGLVVGCLMLIPALLALVGRLGTRLVLPLRLAARDTARQRGRATPAVAAIMAAVAALTALSIGAASDNRHREDAYRPSRPMGTGAIVPTGDDSSEPKVLAVLNRVAPQIQVDREALVLDTNPSPMAGTRTISWVTPVPPGCTETRVVANPPPGGADKCGLLANGGYQVSVRDLAGLTTQLALSPSQKAVLEGGGILTSDPGLIRGGTVEYLAGTSRRGLPDAPTIRAITQRQRFPAAAVDFRFQEVAARGGVSWTWILPETARRLSWPVRIQKFNLTSPTGSISPEVEQAVAERLGDGYHISVERGFQNGSWLTLVILFSVAGLLVLVASLISTALSLAESQNDMATLAAVGATRRTRRAIAASQALVVAAAGCVLGVLVGLVPGIAITWPLTVNSTLAAATAGDLPLRLGPVIAIPWWPLLSVILLVPLLAAALAWVAVRRHPQMTRRLG